HLSSVIQPPGYVSIARGITPGQGSVIILLLLLDGASLEGHHPKFTRLAYPPSNSGEERPGKSRCEPGKVPAGLERTSLSAWRTAQGNKLERYWLLNDGHKLTRRSLEHVLLRSQRHRFFLRRKQISLSYNPGPNHRDRGNRWRNNYPDQPCE